MSEQPYDDDLQDPYENQGNGGGPAVISWNYTRPGTTFTGVVMPADPIERPEKGYKMGREYQSGTDTDPDDKGFMVWPPKNNKENQKRPVTEKKFAELWPELPLPTGRGKVARVEVTMQTKYVEGEFLSDNKKTRLADEAEMSGEPLDLSLVTLRRVLVSGGDLKPKIDASLKPLGGVPAPGQTWSITLKERRSNAPKLGTTSIHEVVITGPTAETLKQVADYVAAAKAEAGAAADAADPVDPYVGGAKAVEPEEPPF